MWHRTRVGLVSDPTAGLGGDTWSEYGHQMHFPLDRAPVVGYLADQRVWSATGLADGASLLNERLTVPKRNLELAVPYESYIARENLLDFKLLQETGQYVSFFPNYDLSTQTLTHFEGVVTSEIGVTPEMIGGSGFYAGGVCGQAYEVTTASYLKYTDDTPPDWTEGATWGMWFRMPASFSNLGFYYAAGIPYYASFGWSGADNDIIFKWGTDATQQLLLHSASLSADQSTWHHIGVSYNRDEASLWWDGCCVDYTTDPSSPPDPGSHWAVMKNSTSAYLQSAIDEVRLDKGSRWTHDQTYGGPMAQYDRFHQQSQLHWAEQTQGHYFAIAGDEFGPAGKAEPWKITGKFNLLGRRVDTAQAVLTGMPDYEPDR